MNSLWYTGLSLWGRNWDKVDRDWKVSVSYSDMVFKNRRIPHEGPGIYSNSSFSGAGMSFEVLQALVVDGVTMVYPLSAFIQCGVGCPHTRIDGLPPNATGFWNG